MLLDQRKRKGYTRKAQQAGQGVLLALPQQNTIIKDRLIETAGLLGEDKQPVTFQHSILCQTCLPGVGARFVQNRTLTACSKFRCLSNAF